MTTHRLKFVALAAVSAMVHAGSTPEIEVSRRDSREFVSAPAENFTGTVRLNSQFRRASPSRLSGALVAFEPGARTRWHTHPVGQTLIVMSGEGFVQKLNGKRESIREGDIVWIPPNVKHWHGAAPATPMSHVAILETLDGKSVEWLEAVTDQQYAAHQ